MQHQYTPCPLQQLRNLIIQRDYNRLELARKTNQSPASITHFVNGDTDSPRVFSALCQHLNITLSTTYAPQTIKRPRRGRPRKL